MSGLVQEFPGKVIAENVDATLPESVQIIAELGFNNHGLVVRAADGEVLLAQPDHEVDIDDVRTRLKSLTRR